MMNKNITKLILDIVMTVLFIILIYPKNTGFTFHEIAGLTMGALFVFHLILNWSWVKSVTKNLLNPRLKAKSRWYYILNTVSFISVVFIIFTGIEISQVLFVSGSDTVNHSFVTLHKWVSYFCLGLFGVHIALHWRFFYETVRKLSARLKTSGAGKAALSAGTAILVIGLLYSQIASGSSAEADQVTTRRQTPYIQSGTALPESGVSTSPIQSETGSSGNASTVTESSDSASQSDSSSSGTMSASSDTGGDSVTLADFLGKMFCTGCEKHCSLLNPQCNKGVQQAQAAKIEYQQLYGTTTVN